MLHSVSDQHFEGAMPLSLYTGCTWCSKSQTKRLRTHHVSDRMDVQKCLRQNRWFAHVQKKQNQRWSSRHAMQKDTCGACVLFGDAQKHIHSPIAESLSIFILGMVVAAYFCDKVMSVQEPRVQGMKRHTKSTLLKLRQYTWQQNCRQSPSQIDSILNCK